MMVNREKQEWQLQLSTLFSWTTLVAIFLLPFSTPFPWGVYLSLVAIPFYLIAIGKHNIVGRILSGLGVVVFFTCTLGLVFGFVFQVAEHWSVPDDVANHRSRVRQIGLALLNYEFEHGGFPPAYTLDDEGNRLHSWRVLILPYLDEHALYDSIDLTKPWDDPANFAAAARMPRVFQAGNSPYDEFSTRIVAVVGDKTMWPTHGFGRKLHDIAEDSYETILAIEAPHFRQHWMSPNDPTYEQFVDALNDPKVDLFGPDGVNYVRGNGAQDFSVQISHRQLLKQLTVTLVDQQPSE